MSKRAVILLAAAFLFALSSVAGAAVLKGPYLQNVNKTGATICFETDLDWDGTVEWGEDDTYGQTLTQPYFHSINFPTGNKFIHKIRIEGLTKESVYHYRIHHGPETSEDRTFVTAPQNMSDFVFVIFGDSRNGSIENPNLNHIANVEGILGIMPEFYINTGDFVSSGEEPGDWDYHFFVEQELMSLAPMTPVFGNHEDGTDWSTLLSGDRLWEYYFDTNHPGDGTWFSFDWGNVHFIILDVNKWWTLLPGTSQHQWLLQDLDDYNANPHTNFLVASFHQPAFTWKEGRTPDIISRLVLEPTLRQNGVDIVFSGHDHFYARCDMSGINHVVTGGGGASLYDFYDWVETHPGYRAHKKDFHYVEVQASSMTLDFKVWSATTDALIDSFTVQADEPPVPEDDDDDTADDDTADDDTADDDSVDDDSADDDTADDDTADDDTTDDDDDDDDDDGCCCG